MTSVTPTRARSRTRRRTSDNRTYTYDANGNQTGWTNDLNGTRRTIVWDEENRVQSIFDNGHEKAYKYDDKGERVIKRGPQGETVYVNQYFTDPQRRRSAPSTSTSDDTRLVSKLVKKNRRLEKDQFFYHADHLGSSNYVTDANGALYEHLEYFPFGETWVQESSNTQRTPYLFSGKELDEETGLYYYGARYYDPRTSQFISTDPLLQSTGPGLSDAGDDEPVRLRHEQPIAVYRSDRDDVALPKDAEQRKAIFEATKKLTSDTLDVEQQKDGSYHLVYREGPGAALLRWHTTHSKYHQVAPDRDRRPGWHLPTPGRCMTRTDSTMLPSTGVRPSTTISLPPSAPAWLRYPVPPIAKGPGRTLPLVTNMCTPGT